MIPPVRPIPDIFDMVATGPAIIVTSTEPDTWPFSAVIHDTPALLPFTVMLALPFVVIAVDVSSVSLEVRLVEKLTIVPSITLLP